MTYVPSARYSFLFAAGCSRFRSKWQADYLQPTSDGSSLLLPLAKSFSFCFQPLFNSILPRENSEHWRSVAASLVEGAYVLEFDRKKKRRPSEARAPAWWEFFHFKLIHKLIVGDDSSIFGAIYEFRPPTAPPPPKAPRYVIAFRGTIIHSPTRLQDVKHDLRIICHCLHKTTRSSVAMEAVGSTISAVGHSNVWLAGHSLWSAFALHVGKNMAKRGILLDSFLFNPPFFSTPVHSFDLDEEVKQGIRIVHSFVTAGLSRAVDAFVGRPKFQENSFGSISSWFPFLLVNKADFFCSEYVEYFEHRKKMEKLGAGRTERIATQNSLRALISTALGKDSDPVQLLPSAVLAINQIQSMDPFQAHGIRQWWQPNLQVENRTYRYE
ncbi:hypothetical protein ACLOJK_009905 [Asimina triloba]